MRCAGWWLRGAGPGQPDAVLLVGGSSRAPASGQRGEQRRAAGGRRRPPQAPGGAGRRPAGDGCSASRAVVGGVPPGTRVAGPPHGGAPGGPVGPGHMRLPPPLASLRRRARPGGTARCWARFLQLPEAPRGRPPPASPQMALARRVSPGPSLSWSSWGSRADLRAAPGGEPPADGATTDTGGPASAAAPPATRRPARCRAVWHADLSEETFGIPPPTPLAYVTDETGRVTAFDVCDRRAGLAGEGRRRGRRPGVAGRGHRLVSHVEPSALLTLDPATGTTAGHGPRRLRKRTCRRSLGDLFITTSAST